MLGIGDNGIKGQGGDATSGGTDSTSGNIGAGAAGFTLIDVLVGSFLASLIFVGIFGAFQFGFWAFRQGEARIVATNIANARIEEIRNLEYGAVGTIGASLPYAEGGIVPQEAVERNGVAYNLETSIKYIVDDTDGVGMPEDECPNDYKKAEVVVSWSGIFGGEAVFVTDIAPEDLAEECVQAGGVIRIRAFNSHGEMVFSPLIEIFEAETEIFIDSASPDTGEHYFPLSPNTYKVVVGKEGYSTARTYGEDEVASPEKPHILLSEGEVEEMAFSIDYLSDFIINTLSEIEEETKIVAVPGVEFGLRGEKIIGRDGDEEPVYKYEESFLSDSSGYVNVLDLEWDNYNFWVDPALGLNLVKTEPEPQPIGLAPDTVQEVDLFVQAENSLLIKVEDLETTGPVFAADVRLFKTGYDKSQFTDESGETYFLPLEITTYSIEAEAPGYNPATGAVLVSGYTTRTIQLERVE